MFFRTKYLCYAKAIGRFSKMPDILNQQLNLLNLRGNKANELTHSAKPNLNDGANHFQLLPKSNVAGFLVISESVS
jgi:hypothetical protein